MGDSIIVRLSLFSLNQEIIVYKDGVSEVSKCAMSDIPNAVINVCKENNISNVKIYGITNYSEKIAQEIELTEKIMYSENKINVEVI